MRDLGIPLRASEGLPIQDEEDRFRHLYCLGKTRTGKTTFFLNLISQEIQNALIVIDPVGGFAESVASLSPPERLIYVDQEHPVIINPLTKYDWAKSAKEFIEVLNACVAGTTSTIDTTVLMEEIILNAIRVFRPNQRNIKYLSQFLNFEEQRRNHAPDEYWTFFDSRDRRGWLQNKEKVDSAKRVGARLTAFHLDPSISPFVIGDNELNIKQIADERKIAVFNLRGFDTNAQIYLGNLISHAVKNYYNYEATEHSPTLFFYVDEFHKFITPFFSDMLSQCGKFNISLNFAHQNHFQISRELLNTVLGNCFTKVVFQVGYDEADRMAKDFQFPAKEIQNLGKYEAYVLIGKQPHKVLTYPPPESAQFIPEPPQEPVNFLRDSWIQMV